MPLAIAIHVAAGVIGIASGFAALSVRKGGRAHRAIGTMFFASMLTMAGFAAAVALAKGQKLNVLAAGLTFYLVATAWAAVRRPAETSGRFEMLAVAWALGVAAAGGVLAATASSSAAAITYLAFGALAGLAGTLDIRAIRRGGLAGSDRIARHLWRMCLALAIAAASFFLGQADEIPAAWRGPHLAIPPLAALAAMAFWLVRLRVPAGWWRPRARRGLNPTGP